MVMAVDGGQDLLGVLGPMERLTALVPPLAEAGMAATSSWTLAKSTRPSAWRWMMAKKTSTQVQPGSVGRGEVQLDAGMGAQPGLDLGVLWVA